MEGAKGKAKEFDEWKEQRKLATKIIEKLEKKKPKIIECSEARTIQRIPVAVIEALLLETQGTGALPVKSFDNSKSFGNEQDEVEIKMCQRIKQLTIELEDLRQSLPAVAKLIKKKRQVEAMKVDTPQINDDEVPVIQLDYKNRKQWEPLTSVIVDGGAGVNIRFINILTLSIDATCVSWSDLDSSQIPVSNG
ncbi:hypothetical protein L7F22_028801 [Adiantum nelumboides]|nr:hypothetical protein [Adiantum nelumboides]